MASANDILGLAPPKTAWDRGLTLTPPKPTADALLGVTPRMAAPAAVQAAVPGARVTSDTRSRQHNAEVGGAANSYHLQPNRAEDFIPPAGMTRAQATARIRVRDPHPTELLDEGTHIHYAPGQPGPAPAASSVLGLPPAPPVPVPPKVTPFDRSTKPRPTRAALIEAGLQGVNDVLPYRDLMARARRHGANANASLLAVPDALGRGMHGDPSALGAAALGLIGGVTEGALGFPAAAAETVLGRPLEAATGGAVPASTMGDAVNNIAPFFVGGVRAPKPAAAAESTTYRALPRRNLGATRIDPAAAPAPRARAIAATVETPADAVLYGPSGKSRGGKPAPVGPPPLQTPSSGLPGAGIVRKARNAVLERVDPAMVDDDARAAALLIRGTGAKHQLAADQTAHELLQLDARTGEMPLPRFVDFTRYLEGRSKGAKLADPTLQPVADKIRDAYTGYRTRIESTLTPEQTPAFIQDYYSHLWKERPQAVADTMNAYFGRQGTGRNFKARSIPTMEDGIAAGLTPRTTNPIQNTLVYAANMSRYLTTHDVLNQMKDSGLAVEHAVGQQPAGWVALDGILTRKPARTIIDTEAGPIAANPERKVFAPPGAARVYNNWISQGFPEGSVGNAAKGIANGAVQLKLGLSGFHAVTMTQEAMASEAARAVGALSRGDLPTAGKAAATWATGIGPAISQTMRGGKMRLQLLEPGRAASPMEAEINDLYIRQGGRTNMDKAYRTTAAGSFWDSMTRGTLVRDIRQTGRDLYRGTPWEVTKNHAALVGKVIQTAAAPIFEWYIPRLKQGAFAQRMGDWLAQNPNATDAEKLLFARQLGDSIDNRFGELVQDNLFWTKKSKEAAQIALVSPTWNLGTIREIGGGLVDIVPTARKLLEGKGLNVSERTAYVAGLAATTALVSSVYQYLKTGEGPQSAQDLMAPRTGGTQFIGRVPVPERAAIPGYQKDIYGFSYDFPNHVLQEGINKLNPAVKAPVEFVTNRDYRGFPIRPEHGAQPKPGDKGLAEWATETALPISVGQLRGEKQSNISAAERILGIRSSPGYVAAPDVVRRQADKRGRREWRNKRGSDARKENRMESW